MGLSWRNISSDEENQQVERAKSKKLGNNTRHNYVLQLRIIPNTGIETENKQLYKVIRNGLQKKVSANILQKGQYQRGDVGSILFVWEKEKQFLRQKDS